MKESPWFDFLSKIIIRSCARDDFLSKKNAKTREGKRERLEPQMSTNFMWLFVGWDSYRVTKIDT